MRNLFLILLVSAFFASAGKSQQTVGLFSYDEGSFPGYTLFAPISSKNTYLIDNCGKLVHSWASTYNPGLSAYLLEDGTLLRTGSTANPSFPTAGGSGGIVERFDWAGNLLWSHLFSDTAMLQHHDIEYLPNGNILVITWEKKTYAQAIAAGRNPALLGTGIWSEKIIEVAPAGANQATIVWEWNVWDHLVQQFDINKPDYGTIADHPERVNLNFFSGNPINSDWLHINAIDYNPALDQVIVSAHNFHEIWVIDHSTTTAEAASHSGGLYGKGGDLLYRWGNPRAYGRGVAGNQVFYSQHDARWIEHGQDSGKIMVFNNGFNRPSGNYSTVDVLNPPVDANGFYLLAGNGPYGPATLDWEYKAGIPADFYSQAISGAERLPNGKTLVCEGQSGHFFEVDTAGTIFWDYVNPVTTTGPVSQGTPVGLPGPTGTPVAVFRCTRYSADYSGIAGQTLSPGLPIELNPITDSCEIYQSTRSGLHRKGTATMYPNPSAGFVHVTFPEGFYEMRVYDASGNLVEARTLQYPLEEDLYLDARGIFLVQLISDQEIISRKIINLADGS